MASRKRHHSALSSSTTSVTPTYTALASLRDKLRSSKKTERQSACRELLEKLQDKSTIKRLEYEAQLMFDTSIRRGGGSGVSLGTGVNIGDQSTLFPRDRVSILYRSLLDSALVGAQITIDAEPNATKTKRTANQTGLIKKSPKFKVDDILFPYKIFMKVDEPGLEVNDGGYGTPPSSELDWKTKPRYGHHLDTRSTKSKGVHHGVFSATYYTPHTFTDDDRGTRLSTKEILASVDYCIHYLNDAICVEMAETELLKWLAHMCSRPDYVSVMPIYYQVSHILDEVGRRIGRTFETKKDKMVKRESLNESAKCLGALIYNLTTRLGMAMQIYTRPVIELVGVWADSAMFDLEGGVRTDQDIIALMPYLYSAVTNLIAAHPEQSVAVLSEHGHSLLGLAKKYYAKIGTNPSAREALTDYIAAHLLVAETSGKLCGLPEGDLGPLEPPHDDEDEHPDEEEVDFEDGEKQSSATNQRKKRNGATLDGNAILSLLHVVRNEKVWESIFPAGDGDKKNKKKTGRKSFPGGKKGTAGGKKSPSLSEGGATWNPLNRRQRRYLELLARLMRVSQRLYLSEAEDVKEGSIDSLELLIEQANDLRDQPSIEKGEIEIETSDNDSQSAVKTTPESLACSPWIRFVCRHLYNLNPKLGRITESGVNSTFDVDMGNSQLFTQRPESENLMSDEMASVERLLFESCPMLQALTVETSDDTTMTELTSTYTAPAFTQSTMLLPNKNAKDQDTVRPTTTATLQLVCASAESFPRGECWSSSSRGFWSTVLDDRHYPNGVSATILERYGSSPSDAAAMIYLLGTTLESFGGTGSDESVQLWTLMALLKMTESSAIICSRDGLENTSFGSFSSLRTLRLAWQYVWKVLFRYDLRYAAYTQGAYDSNAGELVLQLLTQMIRYNCADRMTMISRIPSGRESISSGSPFVHAEQGNVYKLPIFDETSTILSCAPFELVTSIFEHVGFSVTADSKTDFINAESPRDITYFLSWCLRFFESSMMDAPESHIQRSFLPFASAFLASLLSNGSVSMHTSTYELDELTRFSIIEDVEPIFYNFHPDCIVTEESSARHWLLDALWAESIGYDRINDVGSGFSRRIIQGRGTYLNQFLDANCERAKLMLQQHHGLELNGDTSYSTAMAQVGQTALQHLKSSLDRKRFQVNNDGENSSDEEDAVTIRDNKPLILPQLTAYLSTILVAIISESKSSEDIAQKITDVFKDIFEPTFKVILANLSSLTCHPSDRVAVLNQLNGIVRVLMEISAVNEDKESPIPQIFEDIAKSFFKLCKFILKEHRKETYTAPSSPTLPNERSRPVYDDSDDDDVYMPIQQETNAFDDFEDDGDGMWNDEFDMPQKGSRERVQRFQPNKRQRGAGRNLKEDSWKGNHASIDAQAAFLCASLMVLLQPSSQCLELISGHLVWPDEYDREVGYAPISKSPDPHCAMVCASLFCQKSVVLRQDRLLLQLSPSADINVSNDEDQMSPLILCADIICHARNMSTPSSRYFMCGLGIVASLVEIREYGDCCRPVNPSESKALLDVLYPEGIDKDHEMHHKMRQWKKILKLKSSYNTEKLQCATLVFLFAKPNLHEAIDQTFSTYFVKASLRNLDEHIRELAPDAVGAALDLFPDSGQIVSEIERCLPKIHNPKKFEKWREALSDPKLPDNLTEQDMVAMDDAVTSFEFHYIESIGLIAGASQDASISRDMVWKLIEIAYRIPSLILLCLRALKRASLLLGYNKVDNLFEEVMPHLLVKWLETRRNLKDMPLLLTSPFVLEQSCRCFPVDISSMLLQSDGWDDSYFTFVDTKEVLKDRVLHSFLRSVTEFLIPSILLSASEDDFNPMEYISECALILTESESDESIAKVLRREIAAICGYIFLFYDGLPNESDSAMEMFKRCVSSKHIEKDGAKNAHRVLRHMLVLCRKGVSVVGSPAVELSSKTLIDGMKMISKQLQRTSRSGEKASFLELAGSSMTECIVIVNYWLSSSLNVRQREDSWEVFELLCTIVQETVRDDTLSSSELGFFLNAFVTIILDESNCRLLPLILDSLRGVLDSLFNESSKTAVKSVLPTLRKLCLALLQVHESTFLSFQSKCTASLANLVSERRSCRGFLPDSDEMETSMTISDISPKAPGLLKHLIESKVDVETTHHEILLRSFDCVEIMEKSGSLSLKDILGVQEMSQTESEHNRDLFREVNQKYSVASLFPSQQGEDLTATSGLHIEVQNFLHVMNEYPIVVDHMRANLPASSTAVLHNIEARARLLALRRLEKSLLQNDSTESSTELTSEVYNWLVKICSSIDPEESRLISSRCLGEMNSLDKITSLRIPHTSTSFQSQLDNHDGSPYKLMMSNILTSIGAFLVSGDAETSLVAMKTARALLSSGAGKECWRILSKAEQALFRPFVANDEGQQHSSVLLSDSCKEKLKARTSGIDGDDLWCFGDELWNLEEYVNDSYEVWIKNIVCAIISCCLGKDSKVGVRNKSFFRICQGMCAKEASFAAEMFPYLIFSLLDADSKEQCNERITSSQESIISQVAIGTATSQMNVLISDCFSGFLKLDSDKMKMNPQAMNAILSVLDWLKSITEYRFLKADHRVNKSETVQKKSKTSKKRSSNGASSEPSPQWRGCLYGVVLRLDGVDVAKACYHAKRFFSAMYYAEMGMQNMLGSGNFFEKLSGDGGHSFDKSLICDISGFGVTMQNDQTSILESALVANNIISSCLKELEANDELDGLSSQGAVLSLKQNIASLKTLGGLRTEKLASLQDHDISLEESPSNLHEGFDKITSHLEDLGLNHTKHHYLIGVEKVLSDHQSEESRKFLREKWFEDSLNAASQWDDSLLPKLSHTDQLVQPSKSRGAPPPRSNTKGGFYESVNQALMSLEKGDILAGLNNATEARRSILADMESLVGCESHLKGMATHLSRLSVIGNLELTAKTLEGNVPLSFLLNRFGCEAGEEKLDTLLLQTDDYVFEMKDHVSGVDNILARRAFTEFSVQETQLKLLIPKFESNEKELAEALTSHVFKSSHIYRNIGRVDAANHSLSRLRSLVQIFEGRGITYPPNLPLFLHLEDAKLMKSQSDLDTAVMRCKIISSHIDSIKNDRASVELDSLHADSLLLGSLWMAEQNVDAATNILSSFQKAADLSMQVYRKAKSSKTLQSASIQKASIAGFKLAEFAANLYYSVEKRMSSEVWKKSCLAATQRKKELELALIEEKKLEKKKSKSKAGADEKRYQEAYVLRITLEREASMDDKVMQSTIDSLRKYLRMSVESYCTALKLCPTSISTNVSTHVFQLVSLWFKNCLRVETNDIVNELMRANALSIPSYRFVPLTYQLFSRIDSTKNVEANDFQNILRDMVLKLCIDHPYHGIIQLVALANGKRVGGGVDGRNADAYLENVGDSKIDAAASILDDLRKRTGYIPALVESYTTLSDALIGLAMLSTTPFHDKQTKGLSFSQFKLNLDKCFSNGRRGSKNNSAVNKPVIITNPPSIRPDGQYGDGIEDPIGAERVLGFESKFDLTPSGVHRPKIVTCIGSKGGRFKLLVKGGDDLRQDAIMEQVFGTVNDLLRHEGGGVNQSLGASVLSHSSRHLRLITYGITPLTPSCGVLEWVDDTMGFKEYLEDRRGHIGAHSKYNPGEWGVGDCYRLFKAAANDPAATVESKRKAYDKICEKFSPAFRFFFLENFNSSMEAWHTARTAYTRSCAVNSIVGHILGIGDRHNSNILVHTKTGEVVHIDFGFVFEQGKTLTVPELVPFRLTRDIVDGMGPSGTDGVFFKAAEATLGVLRNNADTLLTILSAVVSDPLYKWSISPQKAKQLQQEENIKEEEEDIGDESKTKEAASRPSVMTFNAEEDESKNDAASRAIHKITNKLQGFEDSSSFDKSVAGQVKLLINEARDPGNLSQMFIGWQPWM